MRDEFSGHPFLGGRISEIFQEKPRRQSDRRREFGPRYKSKSIEEMSPEEKAFFEEEQKRLQKLAELKIELLETDNEHPGIKELHIKQEIGEALMRDSFAVIEAVAFPGLLKRIFDQAGIKNQEGLLDSMQKKMEGYLEDAANIGKDIYQQKLEKIKNLKNERKIDESDADELKMSAQKTLWETIYNSIGKGYRLDHLSSDDTSDRNKNFFEPLYL